ncbi:OLC1v1026004C2 [Oldenlandia corymbosa var. corymbosa]|nr:OLC1v1026004C2 [Oldenlandia corymbosa var. corymbosa]
MDAEARKKFRAKVNAKKQDKRIDSPLVRYNEHNQPVCKVCNVALKSESLWSAHQASKKHHEAINNLKASAAAVTPANVAKPEPVKEFAKPKAQGEQELSNNKLDISNGLPKNRPASGLPSDFFDKNDTKRQKNESQGVIPVVRGSKVQTLVNDEVGPSNENLPFGGKVQKSQTATVSETMRSKGALPEGFFDDKDADMLARGITPVKPDVKDEYKEFEKLIQEDLQEVDNRLEEEEVDAAEEIEEAELVEQR